MCSLVDAVFLTEKIDGLRERFKEELNRKVKIQVKFRIEAV